MVLTRECRGSSRGHTGRILCRLCGSVSRCVLPQAPTSNPNAARCRERVSHRSGMPAHRVPLSPRRPHWGPAGPLPAVPAVAAAYRGCARHVSSRSARATHRVPRRQGNPSPSVATTRGHWWSWQRTWTYGKTTHGLETGDSATCPRRRKMSR